MILTQLATAFTTAGFPMTAFYGNWFGPETVQLDSNGYFRILCSGLRDFSDDMEQNLHGRVETDSPILFIFALSPELAVEQKKLVLKEIYKNAEGYLGQQDIMPVEYNGVWVHRFEPKNRILENIAEPYRLEDGSDIWVSSVELSLGIENI